MEQSYRASGLSYLIRSSWFGVRLGPKTCSISLVPSLVLVPLSKCRTVPSSAVFMEQSYRASGLSYLIRSSWFGVRLGPKTCSISLVPSLVLVPLSKCPFISSRVPSFRPQEKKSARCCWFENLNDSGFIAQFLAFYRPNKTLTDI